MSFPEDFDVSNYPHGIVCLSCGDDLTADNVFRLRVDRDATPEDAEHLLCCVDCAISGAAQRAFEEAA